MLEFVLTAADICLQSYGGYGFAVTNEHVVQDCAQVDYCGSICNQELDQEVVLVEAKPPWVMMKMGNLLPAHGIKLGLAPNLPLVPRIFNAVSLSLSDAAWILMMDVTVY